MKVLSALAISAVLLQHSIPPPNPAAQGVHRAVRLNTTVHVLETSAGSAFSDLVAVGLQNHLPIGIVVGEGPDSDICRVPLNFTQETMTVADLIAVIEAGMPGYRAEIQNGVLDIAPKQLPDNTARFLEMRLARFQAAPQTQTVMGFTLWGSIDGILAPRAGRDLNILLSMSAETVPGMDVSNASVKSILNKIVDEGNGGVWVLRTSQLKTLSAETRMPYDIDGYVGEDLDLANRQILPCAEPETH
ncbi:MAG TPA: hypothetical protein VND90_09775 [Terracidiphilus sp.]|nr:hypothetical protein [Terracidiphilus sp.]